MAPNTEKKQSLSETISQIEQPEPCPSFSERQQQLRRSLEEQRLEINRLKVAKAEQQVAAWRAEAQQFVTPAFRFRALLEEGLRFETQCIRNGKGARPHCVSDPDLLEADIRKAYQRLMREAQNLFEQRKAFPLEDLNSIADQAVNSFASLYPWSDGVTCRDLTAQHQQFLPLVMRRLVTAGSSGVITVASFNAVIPIAEVKHSTALASRETRINEWYAARAELLASSPIASPTGSAPLLFKVGGGDRTSVAVCQPQRSADGLGCMRLSETHRASAH